jgi:hypothetical protein
MHAKYIIFKKADGTVLSRIQNPSTNPDYIGGEVHLEADEQIIGIYGHQHDSVIGDLSLLVWKPEKI